MGSVEKETILNDPGGERVADAALSRAVEADVKRQPLTGGERASPPGISLKRAMRGDVMGESKNGHQEKHVLRGILAGTGAGLAASWLMNVFMNGPGQKLNESLKDNRDKLEESVQQIRQPEPKEDATMKAADALVNTATGGRHLSFEARQKAGPVVHYAFGALVGGVYGGLAEYSKTVRKGFGTAFGGALFAGADLVAVPAFRLSPPLSEAQPRSLANPLAAHLVYGTATELLRRVFRAVL